MAIMTITINASKLSVGDMNAKLKDAANPQSGMVELENLIKGIEAGAVDATVAVAVTGGNSVTYNLS
jgi:hypothetical protein